MTLQYTTAVRTARMNAVKDAIDGGSGAGTIAIRTGAAAGVGNAAGGSLLGTLTCSDPCGTVTNGVLTLSAVTADSSADATGTAAHFRISDSAVVAVMEGSITATGGGGDLTLNTVSIVSGGPITLTSGVITAGNA